LRLAQELTELEAGLVELRLAVTGGALEHGGDFVLFDAFYVVEDEDHAVTRGQRSDGALKGDTVDGARERGIA
jgi:hypothetical protein